MTRIAILAIAALTLLPPVAQAQAPDTLTAARALVPLLKSVKERMHPRFGLVPGEPQPSPFTGTQTTLLSFGIGKKAVPVDPKVANAIDRLLAWKIGDETESDEAVLFDHWLTQLTVKAATVGLLNCDAACVVMKFPEPDQAFGRSDKDRQEMRDQLLLDALSAAVDELAQKQK